jgi:RecB family exonuclease
MSIYSFSQIWVYKQCPKKYQYQYIDKLEKEFKSSPDLILWTSVHAALERLYQQINIFKLPSKENILDKFYEIWDKETNKIWNELLYKWDQTAADYIRRWEHYLNHYYDKYRPFDWIKVIRTEVKMYFSLNLNNPEKNDFYGIIDRLDKQWDTYIINDYKTNKNLPPEDKQDYREQLTLYAFWVQQKYWKYLKNIKAKLHFLHFDELDEWDITDEILQPIVDKYSKLTNEIEIAKAKYAESFNSDKNIFPTKANSFCKFCEYQNLCPLFLHMNYWDETVTWWALWKSSIKKLVDKYVEVSRQANELNKEKDSIKDVLIEYADEKKFEQLYWNENTLWLSEGINYSIKNKDEFIKYLKENWLYDKATDIPRYKINNLIKDWDISEDIIDKYLEWKKSRRLTPKKKD